MSGTESPSPQNERSAFREDIALLAMGALPAEEAARLETQLDRHGEERRLYEEYRGLLAAVRRETEPAPPLDAERVLAALRRRAAIESRETLLPLKPHTQALSPRARSLWLGALAALGALGLVLAAVFLHPAAPPAPPRVNVVQKPKPIALLFRAFSRTAEAVLPGTVHTAGEGGLRVRYHQGPIVHLREGARARFRGAHLLELEEGWAAIHVPAGGTAFTVGGPRVLIRVPAKLGARFSLRVKNGKEPAEELAVAEGRVEFRGPVGEALMVAAGRASRLLASGEPKKPWTIDPKAAFAWVSRPFLEALKLTLRVEAAKAGGPMLGVISLRNAGKRPVAVAGYHRLGVNYQLEVRRPKGRGPVFVKILPRTLRRRLAPGRVEVLRESQRDVVLEPGQGYELELDLRPLLKGSGPFMLAAHYLGFAHGEPGGEGTAAAAEGGWGFTLRSPEVKVAAKPPPPKRK